MRLIAVLLFVSLTLLLLSLMSCDEVSVRDKEEAQVTKFFQKHKFGSSPDWAIELQSAMEPERWDHVITVHGFVNDWEMAQKLADHLNQTTNSHYRAVPLNK